MNLNDVLDYMQINDFENICMSNVAEDNTFEWTLEYKHSDEQYVGTLVLVINEDMSYLAGYYNCEYGGADLRDFDECTRNNIDLLINGFFDLGK